MSDKISPILVAETKPYISRIKALPFLNRAERGEVGVAGWHRFAFERYHAARYFVPLIARAEELTRNHDNALLHKAYFDNLQDERGLSDPAAGAHETWRIDFYKAMGIEKDDLVNSSYNAGTQFYRDALKNLIEEGDIFKISGALLFLETTIPHEYRKILSGVEQDFAAQFDVSTGETEAKRKARHYLVDHIHHDAAHHARDLFIALTPYADDPAIMTKLREGMELSMIAKEKLYEGL